MTTRSISSTSFSRPMNVVDVVLALVWRYRQGLPAEALLRRMATEQLVLVGTGASDWLDSTGRAERVDGVIA